MRSVLERSLRCTRCSRGYRLPAMLVPADVVQGGAFGVCPGCDTAVNIGRILDRLDEEFGDLLDLLDEEALPPAEEQHDADLLYVQGNTPLRRSRRPGRFFVRNLAATRPAGTRMA